MTCCRLACRRSSRLNCTPSSKGKIFVGDLLMKKILVAVALVSLVAFASPALAESHYNLLCTFGPTPFKSIGFTFPESRVYTSALSPDGSAIRIRKNGQNQQQLNSKSEPLIEQLASDRGAQVEVKY